MFKKLKERNDVWEEMQECSIAELRLWIIQELATIDSECWWLIEDGVELLKEKMQNSRE